MTSQLARELHSIRGEVILARDAMALIESSTAPAMEKSLARSILMESNSRLLGNVNTTHLARRVEDKVEFWLSLRGDMNSSQAPRWWR